MRDLRIAAREIGHQWRMFWRSPVSAFFTVLFPLLFLVVLNVFNLGATVGLGGDISFAQFLTPGLAVFAMVTAAYTNLAISTSFDRDEGILKRIIGTPMPGWAYLTGKIGAAVGIGLASVVIMLAVGVAAFDVEVVWTRIPMAILVLVVGAAAFAALGMAVTGAAPNGQAAPVIANATILPLALVSGIFFPLDSAPGWLRAVSGVLPLRPFVVAFSDQWNPAVDPGFPLSDLLMLLAWGAVGMLVAIRTFGWEPRPGGRRNRDRG